MTTKTPLDHTVPIGENRRPEEAPGEVTRLLCVSAYLSEHYRTGVLGLILGSPKHVVSPSPGFDLVPVLAHCVRARELDREYAARIVRAWILGALLLTILCLWFVRALADTFAEDGSGGWQASLFLLLIVLLLPFAALPVLQGENRDRLRAGIDRVGAWFLPSLMVAAHRDHVAHVPATELSEETFTGNSPRVDARYRSALAMVGREQYSPVTLYDPRSPFEGAGLALEKQSLALELQPSEDRDGTAPLTEREVIDLVRPRLESLAESAVETSQDRLGRLEITECVLLPGPLPRGYRREELPVGDASDGAVAEHLRDSVGEGGEQRRHFLRVRVGGWGEGVVVTVFVRVHTQGRMLLMEIAPYLLTPLRAEFHARAGLVVALTNARDRADEKAVRGVLARCLSTSRWPLAMARAAVRPADEDRRGDDEPEVVHPPLISLREIVASNALSPFQEMDVTRYVKTLRVRIGEGVEQALVRAGYRTEEFQRQIVNIGDGGVFIGGSFQNGAIATGDGAKAEDNSSATHKSGVDFGGGKGA
ncbi:hypothetical protein ACWGSK_00460 [Nocardiopsis sp. NPDC055551]